MWKCRQKLSCIQRALLENNKPCYWVIKVINLLEKLLFEDTYNFWHCASREFFPPQYCQLKPSTVCASEASMHLYQLNSPSLRYTAFAPCSFLCSAPTVARHANPFHWLFFKYCFLECIPILRVHLLSLFISSIFGTPCHAKFHKGTFFVHCEMKWSLPPLCKRELLGWDPIPGERRWRRQEETVLLLGS